VLVVIKCSGIGDQVMPESLIKCFRNLRSNAHGISDHFAPEYTATEFWGQGYATEGAKAALEYAFLEMHIPEIVSFTVPDNSRSRSVMDRLGMIRDIAGDFLHPGLASDHRLAKHVLYRIQNPLIKV
ncbi:GNAT family N-acetyltransferase, partial [Legionella pneumophila]|nr:GNAT family N-acetyltransferase [Legionella pneumophila]